MKKFFVNLVIVAIAAVSFTSCSMVNEPDEADYMNLSAYYTAEETVGKKVMVLVNLKPAKLAGVLSEGMLLCAEDADGNLSLMVPEKKMPAGAEIC